MQGKKQRQEPLFLRNRSFTTRCLLGPGVKARLTVVFSVDRGLK